VVLVVLVVLAVDSQSDDEMRASKPSSGPLQRVTTPSLRGKEKKPLRMFICIRNGLNELLGFFYRKCLTPFVPASMASNNYKDLLIQVCAMIIFIVAGVVILVAIIWIYQHSECYTREAITTWREGQAHSMKRDCPKVPYPIDPEAVVDDPSRICLTTLKDNNAKAAFPFLRCRNFDGVDTFPNHEMYAKKHGYTIVDNSSILDQSRPPAWSKILAVQAMMKDFNCLWVMWLDADVVIMDSTIKIESLLPSEKHIDLIVTTDRRFTANSGSWIIRNSPWGREFLTEWWGMRQFVRAKGLSLSGDNDAFGHLVRQRVGQTTYPTEEEFQQVAVGASRIRMPARCNFNSYGVFVSKDVDLSKDPKPEWYLSDRFYHDGDFIAHASGIDQKDVGVQLLLRRAT
jgi:galactosyl transferase GMA12/MNN10 family